jgi:hypothetical protein
LLSAAFARNCIKIISLNAKEPETPGFPGRREPLAVLFVDGDQRHPFRVARPV